jgi:DNA-binding XRE family transcriptional regulator
MMTAQFVDIAGEKFAMLPAEDYRRLLALAEDREDEIAADNARARREAGEEYVPADLVNRIIDGESALKVWREYRGLSQVQLAKVANCRLATISEIENGKAQGKPRLWRAFAEALQVDLEDIVPLD